MPTLPKTAYVSLWLPLPSETFIFREMLNLRKLGMSVVPYSLYAPTRKPLPREMAAFQKQVTSLGVASLFAIIAAALYWCGHSPGAFFRLWTETLFRRWRGLESAGENLWCFLAGFLLARKFQADKIEHIHAPWASGPATAAMVASKLTGIPFSFSARAADIHPPEAILADKMRAASFVRVNTASNKSYLCGIAPDCKDKVQLVYNGMTLTAQMPDGPAPSAPPFRLLALGRFTEKKGFTYLLDACALLREQEFPFMLTLAGDGSEAAALEKKALELGLEEHVVMPGFVAHDEVSELMRGHHAFVMPSIVAASGDRDGIPNVIIEALCHRLPVAATEVSGIPEVIHHGKTGMLCPQKDAAGLAEAIMHLLEEEKRAKAMGNAGHNLAHELFDTEKNSATLAELFSAHAL